MYPNDLKYTSTHQWVRVDGNIAIIGITQYAQEQLGEIVYIDLPRPDDDMTSGEVMGSVESVKSISDLYTPVSGKVIEINEDLIDEPAKINEDPYVAWMVKIEMSAPSELNGMLTAVEYQSKLD
ncbi:MAG: glycine cleavage system protein GcvH [bacterium]